MLKGVTKSLEVVRGLPLITYAPRGMGGGGCVLHAKRGGGGQESM